MDVLFATFTSKFGFTKHFYEQYISRNEAIKEGKHEAKYPTPFYLHDAFGDDELDYTFHVKLDRRDPILIDIIKENNGCHLIRDGFVELVSVPAEFVDYVKIDILPHGFYIQELFSIDVNKYLISEIESRLESPDLLAFIKKTLETPPKVKYLGSLIP